MWNRVHYALITRKTRSQVCDVLASSRLRINHLGCPSLLLFKFLLFIRSKLMDTLSPFSISMFERRACQSRNMIINERVFAEYHSRFHLYYQCLDLIWAPGLIG